MGSPVTEWKSVIICKLLGAGGTLFLETQGRGPGTWNLAHLFSREKDTVPPSGRPFSPPLTSLPGEPRPPDDPSLKARVTANLLLSAENTREMIRAPKVTLAQVLRVLLFSSWEGMK